MLFTAVLASASTQEKMENKFEKCLCRSSHNPKTLAATNVHSSSPFMLTEINSVMDSCNKRTYFHTKQLGIDNRIQTGTNLIQVFEEIDNF